MTVTLDINQFVNNDNEFICELNGNIKFTGKRDKIVINKKYDELDLSQVECNRIDYNFQEGESIKNHILPNSLKSLYCSNNKLTDLPELPNSLELLYCCGNNLTSLPKLPDSLKELYCYDNKIVSLNDHLPDSLKKLSCYCNMLTYLPNLPNKLQQLYCSKNKLKKLPELPNSLITLFCSNKKLKELPKLPNSLCGLICDNELEKLPENFDINQFSSTLNINIMGFGKIYDKYHYDKYIKSLSAKKYSDDDLINKLLLKLNKENIKDLYNLYLSLGNKPNENIKIENGNYWFNLDNENPLNILLNDLIKNEIIIKSLIHIYKIDEKLFN